MSTFDQNIANLRQNNRLRTSQIKTYNADVARFDTAKFQRQGELMLLAGELGVNLLKQIEANRIKDQENEDIIESYEKEGAKWLQSEEAAEAEKAFKLTYENQNKQSDYITKIENESGGDLGDVTSEAQIGTGKLSRLGHQNFLNNKNERFGAWANNQLLNSNEIFFAELDGVPTKIQVNDPNLTYNKKIAVWNHLTRKYLKQHDIQKYSKEFLYLPTDRGGSGFMAGIIETRQAALEKLKTEYKIELSEVSITESTRHFANVKTSQSFNDLLTSVKAGFDAKGKPLNYAGAWKRLNDKIFPQMIEAGKLSPDDVLEIGQKTTLNINGKEVILGEHRELEWGEGGKWHRKAIEVWKEKGTRTKDEWDFKTQKLGDNTLKLIKSGEFSKADMQNAVIEIQRANAKGNSKYDFTEINSYINSKYDTQEEADIRVRQLMKDFNTQKTGWRLDEILKSEDIRVKNSPLLAQALAEDKRLWDEVDDAIIQMKSNYATKATTADGVDIWSYNNSGDYRKWKAIEGYAVRYKKQNPNATVADVWDATETWTKNLGGDEVIDTPYNQWEALEADLAKKAAGGDTSAATRLEEHKRKKGLMFVKDSQNKYPNLVPQPTNIEISKEDQKELDAGKFKSSEIELIFTDPNLVIPEEQAVFKNEDIDYNKKLDDIGYIDDSIVDIAASLNLTTAQFLNFRQKANGKEPLKPEYELYLNEKEISTLPSAMRNRILGKINDGQYTPEEIPANVANSFMVGAPLVMTFGLSAEELIQNLSVDYGFDNVIDDDGYFTQDSTEEKALIGVYGATVLSLDANAFNDFAPGGQQLFTQTVKENLTPENLSTMVTDPKFSLDAYSITGDSDFLPLVDFLAYDEEQERLQKLLNKINKFLYIPEDSVLPDESLETTD